MIASCLIASSPPLLLRHPNLRRRSVRSPACGLLKTNAWSLRHCACPAIPKADGVGPCFNVPAAASHPLAELNKRTHMLSSTTMLIHLAMMLSTVNGWGLPSDGEAHGRLVPSTDEQVLGDHGLFPDSLRGRMVKLCDDSCDSGCTSDCDGTFWSWGGKSCDGDCNLSCCSPRWG